MANITNLKGTTWRIRPDWESLSPAIYDVGGYQYEKVDHFVTSISFFDQFCIGYYNGVVAQEGICFYDSANEKYDSYWYDSNFDSLFVTFTSGTHLANTSLIAWLNEYGEYLYGEGDQSCANTAWTITNASGSPSGKYSINGRVTKKDGTAIDFTEFAIGYGRISNPSGFDSSEGSAFSFWNDNTKECLNVYSIDDLPLTICFFDGLSANQTNLNSWLETNGEFQGGGEEPSATITYNGNALAFFKAGKNVTLHTKGNRMKGDIIVSVPLEMHPAIVQEKIATENGEVVPDDGYDGLSKVIVNVPGEVVEEYDGTIITANLIRFTIDGTSYQALEGMTWDEWVESEYNTRNFAIQDGIVRYGPYQVDSYVTYNNTRAQSTDVIIDGGVYGHEGWTSGGSD